MFDFDFLIRNALFSANVFWDLWSLFSSLFPPGPHPQTRETWLNSDIMLRTLRVTFQKVLKGEEEAPIWGELFSVCFLICKMGISNSTYLLSYYLLDLNGRCLELGLTCRRCSVNAFLLFAALFLCFRNVVLCTSCNICPGQTEESLAILNMCSPWWRKPVASRDLAPAPSVSIAGLRNGFNGGLVRQR